MSESFTLEALHDLRTRLLEQGTEDNPPTLIARQDDFRWVNDLHLHDIPPPKAGDTVYCYGFRIKVV